jgi:hypothetical protein
MDPDPRHRETGSRSGSSKMTYPDPQHYQKQNDPEHKSPDLKTTYVTDLRTSLKRPKFSQLKKNISHRILDVGLSLIILSAGCFFMVMIKIDGYHDMLIDMSLSWENYC